MLFDTDVLIWALRGHSGAAKAIDRAEERDISVVNYMELIQGARDKGEIRLLRSFLKDLGFSILALSENIGHRASVYLEEYSLKTALCLADALIAATAVDQNRPLLSGNAKHYRQISELVLKVFRP
ncbi:MAG: type II toxin-antitoxin system VapC family toxin [Desulfobacterales bacterium]|nr:type II toxin-antitoxin system VapC family toxin [Desulfobacterales bacterium]